MCVLTHRYYHQRKIRSVDSFINYKISLPNQHQPRMPKFQSIVLSLYLGYTAAAGCYPAYSSGGTYSVGSAVSQSVTTTTPVSYASCSTPSSTCVNGWITTGGVSTTTKHNFVCASDVWCSSYAPGGTYSDLAWTKDASECSVSRSAGI
jgi:hypothetical protein